MGDRKSILHLTAAVAGGNYYAMAMHLIAGILIGRYVAPEVFGKFSAFGLVLGYVPFLQAGVLNGLNRELPYYFGKGERDRVMALASAGQFWACLVGGIVGACLLCLAIWNALQGAWEDAIGWGVHAILCFLLFYNTYYLQMTYRTSHDFARLAISKVFESSVSVLLIVLVVWCGFYGLCAKALVVALVSFGILYYWRPIRVFPRWDVVGIRQLFKIGCPIFIVGQVFAYWGTMISTVVLVKLGQEGLGLYGIVTMAIVATNTIPEAISQIVYPRMAEEWGRHPNVISLIRIAYRPMVYSFLGMIPFLLLATYLIEPAIKLMIPKYEAAIPAIKWGVWVGLTGCLTLVNNIFNVVQKQKYYLAAVLIGIATTCVSLAILFPRNSTLVVFSQSYLIGRLVFAFVSGLFIYYIHRNASKKA